MPIDLDFEFPVVDDIVYARIDGYFSATLGTKIPCTCPDYTYYVQYVIDPLCSGELRVYYRTVSDGIHAFFRSNNAVIRFKS